MNSPSEQENSDRALAGWGKTLLVYRDIRLWRIFGLGLSSGFPWVMIGSAMTAWLAEEGLSRANIGFFGFIFVAYSINFLWSPLVDRVRLPLLHQIFGQRRSWIIGMQCMVAGCCWLIASASPSESMSYVKMLAFGLALASATQDISIDAYRIDSLPEDDARLMSAGSAMATSGWWTGFAGLGAIPLILVDFDAWVWRDVYQVMAVIGLLLALVPLFSPEPESRRESLQEQSTQRYAGALEAKSFGFVSSLNVGLALVMVLLLWIILGFPGLGQASAENAYLPSALVLAGMIAFVVKQMMLLERGTQTRAPDARALHSPIRPSAKILVWLLVSFIEPLSEFFRRNGVKLALSILLFIFLFKIGEAFLGRMSIVFYKEVGFSNSDIAVYSKLVSWWVTILFSLIGSAVTIRYGVLKGLFAGGVAMAASNLMFALMAFVGPSKGLLVSAVVVDGFTTAWSTVAFVAFLSMMCNRAFTASQYALMASLGTLGRTFMASYSGWLVDLLDGHWALFFTLTSLMVVPSLLLLYRIRHRLRELSADF